MARTKCANARQAWPFAAVAGISAHMNDSYGEDLSGPWHGLYVQPDGVEEHFVAWLADRGGRLDGVIEETPRGLHNPQGHTWRATLEGRRRGHSVSFVKAYDGTAGQTHAIAYDGELSADNAEIEGTWTFAAGWSGTFLMIRRAALPYAVMREVEAII